MPIELKIVQDDTGQVLVSGPIGNKLLCYGLLEAARDAIQAYHEQNKKLVQPASLVLPEFGQGNGHV